jgi:large repetitive protein
MRRIGLVFIALLAASRAFAVSPTPHIYQLTPAKMPVGMAEAFLHVAGNGFLGWSMSSIRISGASGSWEVLPSGSSSTALDFWIPPEVLRTIGHYAVVVRNLPTNGDDPTESQPADFEITHGPGPFLFLPKGIVVEAVGPDGAIATYEVNATSTNGEVADVTCLPLSGSKFPVGTTVVRCNASDANGGSSGQFPVTITDHTRPELTIPGDITVEAAGPKGTNVDFTATAVDTVDGNLHVSCYPGSGALFPIGSTRVYCSAGDSHANVSQGSFLVNVVDNVRPRLSLPSDFEVHGTEPDGSTFVTFSFSAIDYAERPLLVFCNPPSASWFPQGTTVVQCSATDDQERTTTGSFRVTVVASTIPHPHLALPWDITVEAQGDDGAHVPFSANAFDETDGELPVTCTPPSDSLFPIGRSTVTCSATNSHSITTTGTFHVTVIASTGPAPMLTLPDDITIEAENDAGAHVTFTVTAHDQIDGAVPVVCSPSSGSVFALGTTLVTCTAVNNHNKATTGTFHVTVTPRTDRPALTLPDDISVDAENGDGAHVTFTATAHDDVDGDVAVTCTPPSGSVFPIGPTTVSCSATNSLGHTTAGTFHVFVGSHAPMLTLPATITVPAESSEGAHVTFTATAHDEIDGEIAVACTPASGSLFPIAMTPVSCSATNTHGQSAEATFYVRVTPLTGPAPLLTLPDDMTVEAQSEAGTQVTYTASARDDADGDIPIDCSPASGSLFPFGLGTVTCSATNSHGITATGTFTVNIVDTTPPAIADIHAWPSILWPPDHKMVPVIVSVTMADNVDTAPVAHIVDVLVSDPDAAADWQITGALTVNLRAERRDDRDRVYTIVVEAIDSSDNHSTSAVTVTVPHDQSGDVAAPPRQRAVRH